MGVGICAMHYTGMIAATFTTPATLARNAPGGVNPLSFALPVFGIASVLLFVLLCVGLFEDSERRWTAPSRRRPQAQPMTSGCSSRGSRSNQASSPG